MHSRNVARAAAIALTAAFVLVACGSSTNSGPARLSGGKAVWAEAPAAPPNYVFPLTSGAYFSVANLSQFQFLFFRPLYWFGSTGVVKLNSSLSIAKDPVYSNGGQTVTISLKGWKWSDGTPITSRDIEFWQNMVTANKAHWAGYSPNEYPDNIKSATYPDSNTAVFNLDKAYGSLWFTYNELSQITPLPQHIMDKTSATGTVGDYDRDPGTAAMVYTYLDSIAKPQSSGAVDATWTTAVSGPWVLKSFDTEGNIVMTPNAGYSGPQKPTLTEFDETPFTTDTAEFNVIHTGGIDYGYIPNQDLGTVNGQQDPNPSGVRSLTQYTFAPWIGWQITYFQINFQNATNGSIFKQLYFRQAMQHLINQDSYITNIFKGYAYPDYGPVPIKPANPYADAFEQANPYPFDVNAAKNLLQQNGWTVNAGGVDTCSNAGSGTGQCGAGVASGAKAGFVLWYASGSLPVQQEMEALKSDFSQAGIDVTLNSQTFNSVIGDAFGGTPVADMDNWGGGWIFAPDYLPTGDELFSTGAGSNGGAYSDPTNDSNTVTTTTSGDIKALNTYEDYLAQQLPVLWIPVADAQLALVKKTLHGWDPLDPLLQIYPENWYFTAS